MTLYEISEGLQTILWALEDDEVEVNEESLNEALEHLQMSFDEKLNNYCKVIKNYNAVIDGLKDERKRLSDRINKYENIIQRMKSVITECVLSIGETKYKTDMFNINRLNTKKCIVETSLVPDEFRKEVVRKEVDNAKIKEALDEGQELDFAKYIMSCTIQ